MPLRKKKNTISHPNAQKRGMINVSYYITCASVDCTAITAHIQQRITLSYGMEKLFTIHSILFGAVHKLRLQFSEIFDHPPT